MQTMMAQLFPPDWLKMALQQLSRELSDVPVAALVKLRDALLHRVAELCDEAQAV